MGGSRRYMTILAVFVVFHISVVWCDLCAEPSEAQLAKHMFTGVPPKGGVQAGKYSKITGVDDFASCVKACCEDSGCNAVFYTQGNCLTIQCKSDEKCAPGDKSNTISDALLINLRTVGETGATTPQIDKRACEFGLAPCPIHEECRSSSKDASRAKDGVCQCKDGYSRHAITQSCTVIVNATTTMAAKPTPPSVVETTPVKESSTTVPEGIKLTVSAGENKILKYPDNAARLTAFALPAANKDETYTYHWSLEHTPGGEGIGETSGIDEQTLLLSKLIPGLYTINVEVKGTNKEGLATVNVTVEPEPRVNQAPVAVIKPSVLNVKEDSVGILDGADSSDDIGVESYLWEIVSGPITDGFKLESNEGSMLKVKDLSHGEYTVRLTVADADGLKNFTTAQINVEEAVDYPPKANSGDDVIVVLPQNSVDLLGNASSDDKGIVSYEWKLKSDGSADLEGVHEPILHLTHLREGAYTFELEVTDVKGQKSTDEVHVYVRSSQNKAPVAAVEHESITGILGSPVVLDGTRSTDDQLITKYQWSQASGPSKAVIDNSDRSIANVDGLSKGDYVFKLTVFDAEDLHNSTNLTVKVREHSNEKPKAKAEGEAMVVLPIDVLRFDGSKSTDDGGKLTYRWTKGDESPGAGVVINGSDSSPILLLTNVVPGAYSFTLLVTDEDGKQDSDTVTINVHPDPQMTNLVELSLDAAIESFTEKHKKNLATQLGLMLPSETGLTNTEVLITGIYPDYHSGKLTILFLVRDHESATLSHIRNGTKVITQLREKLDKDSELLEFRVSQVDTVVCQNECSGHGYCDQFSKQCVCEPFWMPNYALYTWKGESNCAWSILYVVVIVLAGVFVLALLIWLCVCCTRRCKRTRGRRKHTYKLLQDIEEMENEEKLAKKKRSNITTGNGSIFLSETDLSSEEDTLFANGKSNTNSHNLNQSQDNSVKANNLKNKFRA